jgi:hypothetical protein
MTASQASSGFKTTAEISFGTGEVTTTSSTAPSKTYEAFVGEGLVDDEHTHAEDYVLSVVPQKWALQKGGEVVIDNLRITSSPCSSTFGTSSKTVGCAENLINYYKSGIPIKDMYTGEVADHVKFRIKTLEVDKLYRPRIKDAADKSMQALMMIAASGLCDEVYVAGHKMPKIRTK